MLLICLGEDRINDIHDARNFILKSLRSRHCRIHNCLGIFLLVHRSVDELRGSTTEECLNFPIDKSFDLRLIKYLLQAVQRNLQYLQKLGLQHADDVQVREFLQDSFAVVEQRHRRSQASGQFLQGLERRVGFLLGATHGLIFVYRFQSFDEPLRFGNAHRLALIDHDVDALAEPLVQIRR